MKNILEIKNLRAKYGENTILNGLDLDIITGEILMLVGANGAGKSTLLKAIFGMIEDMSGDINLNGKLLTSKTSKMVENGISFVPQDFRIFPEMSVEENIKIGAYTIQNKQLIEEGFYEILNLFPKIKNKLNLQASVLSGGERQMLALGRSLMIKPKLLLLDEPSLGLAPSIVMDIFYLIEEINKNLGTTIVIVEHNLKTLLNVANRAAILVKGKIAKEGNPKDLLNSKLLEDVFFGKFA